MDPTGYIDWPTCVIRGDYGTCTIWDGDTYYKIGREIIAAGVPIGLGQVVADITALNPQNPNPDYIRIGDTLTLRTEWILAVINSRYAPPPQPPTPTPEPPPAQPPDFPPRLPPPILRPPPGPYRNDNFTGSLEGKGARASLLALNLLAGGREVVYDFVNLQRATFDYRQLTEPPMPCGVAFELASLGISGYFGAIHFPATRADHLSKYAGEAVSLSVGVGLIDLGKFLPRLQGLSVSGELSAFASTPGNLLGIPGVDLSNPYYGATISLSGGASRGFRLYSASVIYLHYKEISRVPYPTAEDMARAIRAGVDSPVSVPGFIRDVAADHLLWMWGTP